MSPAPLVVLAAASEASGINPYVVGGVILLILIVLMAALLAFGRGRDHS
jgi:uncharacterized membrane protein